MTENKTLKMKLLCLELAALSPDSYDSDDTIRIAKKFESYVTTIGVVKQGDTQS